VEDAPKVSRHAFISKWAFGARASGGHHGLGGTTSRQASTAFLAEKKHQVLFLDKTSQA